jgi:hypothetical protein
MLTAIAHTIGQLGPHPTDPMFVDAWSRMGQFRFSMGPGLDPAMTDVWNAFSWTMSILTAGSAIFVGLSLLFGDFRMKRAALWSGSATVLAAAAVSWRFDVGAPAISYSTAGALLLAAAITTPASDS